MGVSKLSAKVFFFKGNYSFNIFNQQGRRHNLLYFLFQFQGLLVCYCYLCFLSSVVMVSHSLIDYTRLFQY